MALDLGKLLKQEAYACVDTCIGELCVFSINVKGQTELHKKLDTSLKECSPSDFVRSFCLYVCYPKESLKDNKYKPESPVLTDDDVNKLSEDDLEKIAGIYIENNEYLFKKLVFKKKTNEKGETVNYGEYEEIEHPRNEKESNIFYLHRLSILEDEKRKKQFDDMFKSVSGFRGFSSKLTDSIKDTLTWGNSLSKAMESIRPINQPHIRPIDYEIPSIDIAKISRENEERRLQPFNELSERLDRLIESSVQASEFMIEANKIQTQIAIEIKTSGDVTERYSKKNILLSGIVIFLTIVGLSLTTYAIISGNSFNEKQQDKLQNSAEAIVTSLAAINKNLSVENSRSQKSLDFIAGQIVELSKQKAAYEHLLAQHKALIESLERANTKQNFQLIELQKKIDDLEKRQNMNSKMPNKAN